MDKELSIRAKANDVSGVYVLPSTYSFGDDEYQIMEEWLARFRPRPEDEEMEEAYGDAAEIDAMLDEFEARFGVRDDDPEDWIYDDHFRELEDDTPPSPNAPGM